MIFQSLRNYLKPPVSKGPLWMTPDQIVDLRQLATMREWNTYLELLDNVINVNAESLLSAEGEMTHFMRGTIFGIREAVRAVDAIIKEEDNERTNRTDRAERERDRAVAALYGTGLWTDSGYTG